MCNGNAVVAPGKDPSTYGMSIASSCWQYVLTIDNRSDNTATVAYINHQGGLHSVYSNSPATYSYGVRSL